MSFGPLLSQARQFTLQPKALLFHIFVGQENYFIYFAIKREIMGTKILAEKWKVGLIVEEYLISVE